MIPTRANTGDTATPTTSRRRRWSGRRSRWMIAAALLCLEATAPALAAGSADAKVERGRALYERHCRQCHTEGIHRRANKMPLTRDELSGIVDHFRRTANLGWTPEEIDDVVEYLNRTIYRLAR